MRVRRMMRRVLSGVVLWVMKQRQVRGMLRRKKLVKVTRRAPWRSER